MAGWRLALPLALLRALLEGGRARLGAAQSGRRRHCRRSVGGGGAQRCGGRVPVTGYPTLALKVPAGIALWDPRSARVAPGLAAGVLSGRQHSFAA